MKKIIMYIALLMLPILCSARKAFVIEEGRTVILTGKHASSPALLAAHELQYFVKQSLGIHVPIVNELPSEPTGIIYVGNSEYTDKIHFEPQEYLIQITPETIVLMGQDENYDSDGGRDNNGITPSKDRLKINYSKLTGNSSANVELTLPSIYDAQGTCYAVYDFVENYLGVRFYGPAPLNVIVPRQKQLKLAPTRVMRSPAIKYRDSSYSFDWPMMKEQYFEATPEMTQLFLRRIRFGGEKWAANHAFTAYQDRFLQKNPDRPELFEGYHPEYFAVGRTGGPHERQFCYTNQAFIKQVAKDARDYFDGQPLKGEQIALGDYFAVVPLDNANWCQCEECSRQLAIDKDNIRGEHFNCGTATHYLWTFINNVAKEVKKTHPGKKIAALAYHVYAYLPEDIELEDNISVAPCLHPRNYWAPKMKENEAAFYKDWIEESRKSHRPVYLWNYLCFPTERGLVQGFNVFPGFSIHQVAEETKMYARDGVRGIFLCGIGEQFDFYATMKLYDNPALDIDHLLNEFFTSYFGKAARPMRDFYDKIEQVYSDSKNYPLDIQTKDAQFHQTEAIAWEYLGTDRVMKELEGYIRKAQSLADSPAEKARVDSWVKGVWEYMQTGKAKYISKKAKE